jgi:hypothetical protein
MAINFPDSPTNGQTHAVGTFTWQYDGEKWVSANGIALDGLSDVTAPTPTSGDFLKWNGTAWVNDAIDLGTDTTGSYVSSLVAGTGVTLTNNSGEGATPTVTVDTTVIQARVTNVTDTEIGYLDGVTSSIQTQIDTKAPLASPTFTGVPAAPTAAASTNTTQVATTAFVRAEVAALVNSAGATLDTLGEIATALGNDAALSTTLTNSIALKAPLASPTFTGTVTIPAGASISGFATLASPTFTGTVTLPANTVTSSMILNETIANINISSSAAIDYSKLSLSNSIATTDLVSGPARAGFNSTLRTVTSSNTLIISDLAKLIVVNSSSTANITVPADNTVNFNVGDRIDFVTINTGLVTFIAGDGVTVNGTPGLNLRTRYSGATLVKLAANTWVAMGDLKQ